MNVRMVGLFCAAALIQPAAAAVVLDQYYYETSINASNPGSDGNARRVQTFSVGKSGLLQYVDYIGAYGGASMALLATTTGAPTPTSAVLATATYADWAFGAEGLWFRFDFRGAGLQVQTGDIIGIEIYGSGINAANGRMPGGYSGGTLFWLPYGGTEFIADFYGFDQFLRTYVDETVAAPEPGTLALLGLGLAGLGLSRRRKVN